MRVENRSRYGVYAMTPIFGHFYLRLIDYIKATLYHCTFTTPIDMSVLRELDGIHKDHRPASPLTGHRLDMLKLKVLMVGSSITMGQIEDKGGVRREVAR
jgi:hypothetical protein